MEQKPGTRRTASKKIVKDILRATRRQYSAEKKIGIVVVLNDVAEAGLTNTSHEEMNHERIILDLESFAKGLVLGNPAVDEINQRGGVDPRDGVERVHIRLKERFGLEPAVMLLIIGIYTAHV